MNALLVSNGSDGALQTAVCERLQACGIAVRMLGGIGEIRQAATGSDAVIAIGGDGTIMHAAKAAAASGCPVLGINGGHLGFLAGLERNELDRLSALATGDYRVEERMLLSVTVKRRETTENFLAVNEAVISRGTLSQLVDITVTDRGSTVLTCRADGVIFATPTGSTAYSLSAGGPVVDPGMDCLLMTPICPHTIAPKAYILPPDAVPEIRATAVGQDAFLTVDGEENVPLTAQDHVTVCRADAAVKLIRLKPSTFYDVFREKMIGHTGI